MGALASSMRHDGTIWLAAGSLIAGLAAYGFQVVGARGLGTEAFAPVATLWTVQFVVIAIVFFAVEQYEVRSVAAADGSTDPLRRVRPLLSVVLVCVAVVVTLVDRALLGSWELALVGGAWVISVGALSIARGIAGGRGQYRVSGIATGSDSLARFLLSIPAVLAFGTTFSVAMTMPLGATPFLVWWWLRGRAGRAGVPASGLVSTPAGRFLAATAFANGTLQLLLGSGPVIVSLLAAPPTQVSALFITTTLARAPLLVGISLLPRILTPLTRRASAGSYAGVRGLTWAFSLSTVLVAVMAGLAAGVLGPSIVGALYGHEFAVSGLATGAAFAAVVVALGALGLNQVLLAEDRPLRLVPAWTAGLAAAALAVLAFPAEALVRVTVAALVGQAVALGALAFAITTVQADTTEWP